MGGQMASHGLGNGQKASRRRGHLRAGALRLCSATALVAAWALIGGQGTPAAARAERLSAGILGTASGKEADAALRQLWWLQDRLVAALRSDVYKSVHLPWGGTTPIFANAGELIQDVEQLVRALELLFGRSAEHAGAPWARAFAPPVSTALHGLSVHAPSPSQRRTAPWVPAVKGIGNTLALAAFSIRKSLAESEAAAATTACGAGVVAQLSATAALREAGDRKSVV